MLLQGKRVACLEGDDYEDLEVWYPVLRLQKEGAQVYQVGLEADRNYTGKHGYPCRANRAIRDVKLSKCDGNLVSARRPPDLPAFCRLIIHVMTQR